MTTKQFNDSVNADIRRMINKAEPPPESFSDWLKSNSDSIEMPLDRTEATAQWFDDKAKTEIPF